MFWIAILAVLGALALVRLGVALVLVSVFSTALVVSGGVILVLLLVVGWLKLRRCRDSATSDR